MKNRKEQKRRRHQRLRQRIKGTADRPRMSICVSNKNIYVQFIDDEAMRTLAAASTVGQHAALNISTAREVGKAAAEAAQARGIGLVVVDRGGQQYHGRVRAVVETAVAAGLKISTKAGSLEGTGAEIRDEDGVQDVTEEAK